MLLAITTFAVEGNWISNNVTGSISGDLTIDTETSQITDLSLSRRSGNIPNGNYTFTDISGQTLTPIASNSRFEFTTNSVAGYSLHMSWMIPGTDFSGYEGGNISSFDFTGASTFVQGRNGTLTGANHTPTDIFLTSSTINENVSTGTVIGLLSTSDADAGESHSYSLVAGDGADDNLCFEIVGDELQTVTPIDFEQQRSYSVRIKSTDAGGRSVEKQILVTVNDVNEPATRAHAVRLSLSDAGGYSRLVQRNLRLERDTTYTFTAKLVGKVDITRWDSFPELWNGGEVIHPANRNSTYENGTTTYTATVKAPATADYDVKFAFFTTNVDFTEVSLKSPKGTELLTNGAFIEGLVDWDYENTVGGGSLEYLGDIFLSPTTITVNEDTNTADRRHLADIRFHDDALGTNAVTINGPDADAFMIDGNSLFLAENVALDYEIRSSYSVTVTVRDEALGTGSQFSETFELLIGDVAETEPWPNVPSIDGIGNNEHHPLWGSAGVPFTRTASPNYEDGSEKPWGTALPNARTISNIVMDQGNADLGSTRGLSSLVFQWGQFIDHDITLTDSAVPTESFDVEVPVGDKQFDPFQSGTVVIPLNRSEYQDDTGGGITPRQQLNSISSFIDASMVYGSDATRAAAIREFQGGRLLTSSGNLLPFNVAGLPNADLGNPRDFFLAGDVRANEQSGLTAMHTLWVREHNRLANDFARSNPEWTDEEVYQEARRWVTAEIQAITYNEFLPAVLGPNALSNYSGYDFTIDATVSNEFATAAFRVGHTMLPSELLRLDSQGNVVAEGNLSLQAAFFAPNSVIDTGIEPILRGLAAQTQQEVDRFLVDAVRNFLFGPPGSGGLDLASLNIQRGREHGLPSYNQMRIAIGKQPAATFADITSDPLTQQRLEEAYGSVENVDLWVGGIAETHLPGSSLGDTFTAIWVEQFERLRSGDRFWFQNIFSGSDLDSLQNLTLRDVLQANGVSGNLQENVFFVSADLPKTGTDNALFMSPVLEDAASPAGPVGTLVSSILNQRESVDKLATSDGANLGIAITSVHPRDGELWYSIDNGRNWSLVGDVSTDAALGLYADGETRLYYRPGENFSGTISDLIAFRLWDYSDASPNASRTAQPLQDKVIDTLDSVTPAIRLELAPNGAIAVVGQSEKISIVNTSAPNALQLLGQLTIPGHGGIIDAEWSHDGNFLYAISHSQSGGLHVIDVRDPTSPTQIAFLRTVDYAHAVQVSSDGNTLFIADGNAGIVAVDITTPASPRIIGTRNVAPYVQGATLSADGKYLYLSCWWQSSLLIADVSDPKNMHVVGTTHLPGNPWSTTLSPSTNIIYVADRHGAVHVIDVSLPSAPSLLTSLEGLKEVRRLAMSTDGTRLYAPNRQQGVSVFDITSPDAPTLVTAYQVNGTEYDIALAATTPYAFVAEGTSGIAAIALRATATDSFADDVVSIDVYPVNDQPTVDALPDITREAVYVKATAYPDFSNIDGLAFEGAAVQFEDSLRLNGLEQYSNGTVWIDQPLDLARGFSTRFKFAVGSLKTASGADNIGLLIRKPGSNPRNTLAAPYEDTLAVWIDTYDNGANDPNNWHLDVITTSGKTIATGVKLPGTKDTNRHDLEVNWSPETERFDVLFDDVGVFSLVGEAAVSLLQDILTDGQALAGLHSWSGAVTETHDVFSWTFSEARPIVHHVPLTGITAGGGESQPLRITATSNNLSLIPQTDVTYSTPDALGELRLTTTPGQTGTTTVTVTVEDGGLDSLLETTSDNAIRSRSFEVTITAPANGMPTVDKVADITVTEDSGVQVVYLTGITDGDGATQPLRVTATSSDATIVPQPNVTYFAPNKFAKMDFAPVTNHSGTVTISVTVEDGGHDGKLDTPQDNAIFTRNFDITVTPENDAPTLDPFDNIEVNHNSPVRVVDITGISPGGGETQPVRITATSSNPAVIPHPAVTYASPQSTGTLSLQPIFGASGKAEITVWVEDGGLDADLATKGDNGTTSRTFDVDVFKIEAESTFSHVFDLQSSDDPPLFSVSNARIYRESFSPYNYYWGPETLSEWAEIVYKFETGLSITDVQNFPTLHVANANGGGQWDYGAKGYLDVSLDGKTWTNVVANTSADGVVYPVDPTAVLRGGTTIYVRARLFATKEYAVNNVAYSQFLRSRPELGVFQTLKVNGTSISNHAVSVSADEKKAQESAYSGGGAIIKNGEGTLVLNLENTHTGGLIVEAGTVILQHPNAINGGSVVIKSGAKVILDVGPSLIDLSSFTFEKAGLLDIGSGGVRISSGGFVESEIRQLLTDGFNQGDWNSSNGIVDTTVGAGRGLGYKIDENMSLTIRETYNGDADIDGDVDADDVLALCSSYGVSDAATWSDGDMNYDGAVDFHDFFALFQNYGVGTLSSDNVSAEARDRVTSEGNQIANASPLNDNGSKTAATMGPECPADFTQPPRSLLTRNLQDLEATNLAFAALAAESQGSKKTEGNGIKSTPFL